MTTFFSETFLVAKVKRNVSDLRPAVYFFSVDFFFRPEVCLKLYCLNQRILVFLSIQFFKILSRTDLSHFHNSVFYVNRYGTDTLFTQSLNIFMYGWLFSSLSWVTLLFKFVQDLPQVEAKWAECTFKGLLSERSELFRPWSGRASDKVARKDFFGSVSLSRSKSYLGSYVDANFSVF